MAPENPMTRLARWAAEAGPPSTMTLATAGPDGTPHARTVLVTGIDDESLRFHTSRPTTKTRDVAVRPQVAGVFYWPEQGRQVVLAGTAGELEAAASRAAFASQPRGLRRLAWVFEVLGPDAVPRPGQAERAFADAGDALVMPPSWTTLRIVPDRVDFWEAGDDDRPATKICFELVAGRWGARPALP